MRGRTKGDRDRIVTLAHQTEVMARQKTLKPLAKYLEPPKTKAKPESAVLAMMRRLKAKQQKG